MQPPPPVTRETPKATAFSLSGWYLCLWALSEGQSICHQFTISLAVYEHKDANSQNFLSTITWKVMIPESPNFALGSTAELLYHVQNFDSIRLLASELDWNKSSEL